MPEEKICPLFLIFYKTENVTCIENLCSLWSSSSHTCSITFGTNILFNISESLQKLVDILSTRLPDKT